MAIEIADPSEASVTRPGLERLCKNVVDIRNAVGTPYYAYDWSSLQDSLDVLLHAGKESNVDGMDIRFNLALFALPNIVLFRRFMELDASLGITCNTPEEVTALRKSGWADWDRVVFSGGVLPRCDLMTVAGTGCLVNAASLGNLDALTAGSFPCRIGVRVDLTNSALKGIRPAELPSSDSTNGRHIQALHAYPGTEIEKAEVLIHHAESLARKAAMYTRVAELNFGGGFPYDYNHHTGDLSDMFDFGSYFKAVGQVVRRHLRGRSMQLTWEPGRVVFANSGFFVTEVVEVRENSADVADVYIDASFTNIPSLKLRGRQHRVLALSPSGTIKHGAAYQGRLCGATTLSADQLLPEPCLLPKLEPGDILVIVDVGAYGRSGSYNFLGKSLPPEVLIEEHGWHLIRKRQSADHMLEGLEEICDEPMRGDSLGEANEGNSRYSHASGDAVVLSGTNQ